MTFVVAFASAPRCFTLEEAITILQEMVASDEGMPCHQEEENSAKGERALSEGRQCECEIADSHNSFPPPQIEPDSYENNLVMIITKPAYQNSIKHIYFTPDTPPPRRRDV